MAFRCPQCHSPGGLEIECSIELPPDRYSDEISLQIIRCRDCIYTGLAVYAEERGSCPECEGWRHLGYWVSPDAVEATRNAICACPNPHDRQCDCPAHRSLSEQDLTGHWKGLLELERGHTFSMRIHLG